VSTRENTSVLARLLSLVSRPKKVCAHQLEKVEDLFEMDSYTASLVVALDLIKMPNSTKQEKFNEQTPDRTSPPSCRLIH
jgi:hypothetical protein